MQSTGTHTCTGTAGSRLSAQNTWAGCHGAPPEQLLRNQTKGKVGNTGTTERSAEPVPSDFRQEVP